MASNTTHLLITTFNLEKLLIVDSASSNLLPTIHNSLINKFSWTCNFAMAAYTKLDRWDENDLEGSSRDVFMKGPANRSGFRKFINPIIILNLISLAILIVSVI